ncbi:uncharacterized protein LOC133910615 [Phragmites australis]|uniref:uncharacterized protein LOC133910615 n=1 Tax=Phragmites australis TaxID=29695 RepID=UPI002D7655E5|nr:uncharacterized protein LOC133910615 [Phragmites australis]
MVGASGGGGAEASSFGGTGASDGHSGGGAGIGGGGTSRAVASASLGAGAEGSVSIEGIMKSFGQSIKRKTIDLKTLWSKAAKSKKTEINSSSPSIQLPVPDNEIEIAASTEPDLPVPLSTIIENDDNDDAVHEEAEENEAGQVDDSDDGIYDVDLLPRDPGKRIPIADYDINDQDRDNSRAGGDAFVNGGFKNWNHKEAFKKHVGDINSAHNQAQEKYDLFVKPKTSIEQSFASTTKQYKVLYIARLTWSLRCIRFLLRQGLAFRGHDESEDSKNKGNFLELLNFLANNFQEVNKVVLKNAPKKNKMIDHKIQKDLISSCAKETTKLIMEDLGNEHFSILADESSDVSLNEQLALCLRYVDKKGKPVERFLGVVNVEDTTSSTLKTAIGNLLMGHQLSFSMVRGQGYDGASNMKGHINGLKKLIMDESPSAYYIHCFAHQLQLTLVAVAKESGDCQWFFQQLLYLLNVLGNSCKKIRMLRVAQAESIIESLELGELETGQGLNQEMGLGRPGDTRWGSHYKTILHIIALYQPIRNVLIKIGEDYSGTEAISAQTMLTSFESFEFVFMLHLMEEIFGYTDDLCNALQKREQDIVNAISLVYTTKEQLQLLREDGGWDTFFQGVISFCVKHKIKIADMDGRYKLVGRSARFYGKVTNKHRFHVDMFLGVIDRQLRELNDRFDEVNTKLLICMASFNPIDSFAAFDKENLVKLARFYPKDFTKDEMLKLPNQLRNYIADVRRDERFKDVKNLTDLSIKLVETKKSGTFEVVYKLIKLVLILPVATASVERVFSSMTYVKNKLRNKMRSQYMNDCLVIFIERDFFLQVEDDAIIAAFQKMKNRKVEL